MQSHRPVIGLATMGRRPRASFTIVGEATDIAATGFAKVDGGQRCHVALVATSATVLECPRRPQRRAAGSTSALRNVPAR